MEACTIREVDTTRRTAIHLCDPTRTRAETRRTQVHPVPRGGFHKAGEGPAFGGSLVTFCPVRKLPQRSVPGGGRWSPPDQSEKDRPCPSRPSPCHIDRLKKEDAGTPSTAGWIPQGGGRPRLWRFFPRFLIGEKSGPAERPRRGRWSAPEKSEKNGFWNITFHEICER